VTDDEPAFEEWEAPEALFSDAPIRERMLDVIVGLRTPTTVSAVADRVDCDPETARDYLGWFAEMGMVHQYPGRPVRYEVNRSYLRWRRVERIREALSEEEIVEELGSTRATIAEFRARFDAGHPDDVSLLAVDDDVEAAWEALSAWQSALERAALLDAARMGRTASAPVDA